MQPGYQLPDILLTFYGAKALKRLNRLRELTVGDPTLTLNIHGNWLRGRVYNQTKKLVHVLTITITL